MQKLYEVLKSTPTKYKVWFIHWSKKFTRYVFITYVYMYIIIKLLETKILKEYKIIVYIYGGSSFYINKNNINFRSVSILHTQDVHFILVMNKFMIGD